MIILDTNVVSEFIRPQPDRTVLRWLDSLDRHELFITSMTTAELLSGVARLPRGNRRSQIAAQVARLLDVQFADRIVGFSARAAVQYARIRASRDSAGRPIGIADAIIAATAVSEGADQLVTRNVKDFADVGIELVNPWLD